MTKKEKLIVMHIDAASDITAIILNKEAEDMEIEGKINYVSQIVCKTIMEFAEKMASYKRKINRNDLTEITNIFREGLLEISSKIPSFIPEEDFVSYCVITIAKIHVEVAEGGGLL